MITPNLFGMLALRQHAINNAMGITWVTSQVDLYLTCYQQRQQEMTRSYAQAFFYQMMIKEKQKEFKELLTALEAGGDVEDTVNRMEQIEGQIEELVKLMEKTQADV